MATATGNYVVLQQGSWTQTINVDELKDSFARDIYYEQKLQPGHVFDVSNFSFSFEQAWPYYERLLAWEAYGPDIFLPDHGRTADSLLGRQLRSNANLPPLVYYSDVVHIARVMGTRNSKLWSLYTAVDDRMTLNDRYNLYTINGKRVKARRAKLLTSRIVGPLHDVQLTLINEIRGKNVPLAERRALEKEAFSTLEGIAHNAFLMMIAEGRGRAESVFGPQRLSAVGHDRYSGSGLVAATDNLVEGLNWSYTMWGDVSQLYERMGVSSLLLPAEAKALSGVAPIDSYSWPHIFANLVVSEYALPILYWRIFSELSDDIDPRVVGLHALLPHLPPLAPNTTIVPVVHAVNSRIFEVLRHEQPHYFYLFVQALRRWLGTYALLKVYDILNFYANKNQLSDDDSLSIFLDTIYAEIPSLDDKHINAANDVEGWYLSAIPSDDEQHRVRTRISKQRD